VNAHLQSLNQLWACP